MQTACHVMYTVCMYMYMHHRLNFSARLDYSRPDDALNLALQVFRLKFQRDG